jgi:hypothetical protein
MKAGGRFFFHLRRENIRKGGGGGDEKLHRKEKKLQLNARIKKFFLARRFCFKMEKHIFYARRLWSEGEFLLNPGFQVLRSSWWKGENSFGKVFIGCWENCENYFWKSSESLERDFHFVD